MFSLHGYASTTGTYSSLTAIPAAADPVLSTSGNFIYVPTLSNIFGVYAMGTGLLRAQLSAPSLLADVPMDVTPVDANVIPASPLPIQIDPLSPTKLVTDEPLQVAVTTGSSADVNVGILLSDGPLAKVSGRILHVRATTTTAATARAWFNSTLTLTNQLAEGTYDLVGARVDDAHTIFFRFVLPGGPTQIRPGGIGSSTIGKFQASDLFRNGNLGVWGTFSNRVLPTIDTMTDGTSGTAVVILDLIKKS